MDRRLWAALFLVGCVFCWLLTSPPCLAYINWDNGAYLCDMGARGDGWSNWAPWNAHFAIQNVYLLGVWAVAPFGGTLVDGFRLGTAVFFGLAVAIVGDAARRLSGSRLVAVAIALAWMTSWVIVFLVITLEDNILYLPSVAGVMWLCALRADDWRRGDSLRAGVLAGIAALMSWQAILYPAPPFYVALVGGARRRSAADRAGSAALVVIAFLVTLFVWIAFIAATSRTQTFASLVKCLFGRPAGRFDLRRPSDIGGALHAIGVAGLFMGQHVGVKLRPTTLRPEVVGAVLLAAFASLFVVATVVAHRQRRFAPHVVAATLLLFVVVSPIYIDVDYRYLIRFDFLPLLLGLLLAMALRAASPRGRAIAAAALLSLVALQCTLARRYIHERHASYPTQATWLGRHSENAWYGREGKSWFAYFRSLRRSHPHACRFVFAQDEIADGSWNLDLMGSLWSELPEHVVAGDVNAMKRYRFPPRTVSLVDAKAFLRDGCSYVSPDARTMLAR